MPPWELTAAGPPRWPAAATDSRAPRRMVPASGPRPPGAIPHTLSAYPCIDFVNSRFTDHTGTGRVYDRLRLPGVAGVVRGALRHRARAGPGPIDHTHADRAPRHASGAAGSRSAAGQVGRLSSSTASSAAQSQFWELHPCTTVEPPRLRWQPEDWRAVVAATVLSYAQLVAGGHACRVKVCANPDCTWIFFDQSRNRSRGWCESARLRQPREGPPSPLPALASRRTYGVLPAPWTRPTSAGAH